MTVDLLFLAEPRNAVLAVEAKGGTVQSDQADRYSVMTALDVVQTGSVTIPDPSQAILDVAYAVDGSRVPSMLSSLLGSRAGVLGIDHNISWEGKPPQDAGLRTAFGSPIPADLRAIPRLLIVDDASPASAIAAELANAIQAEIEQGRESVTVSALLERTCWGWPRYGRAFRGAFQRKVQDMLRDAAKDTLSGVIEFEKARQQSEPTVRFVVHASEASTQAGELRSARALRARLDSFGAWATGEPVPSIPGQLELELGRLDVPELEEEDE